MSAAETSPPTAVRREYSVVAATNGDGTSTITTRQRQIVFDSSPRQGDVLPGPADLAASAFAACVLKNVERFGEMLDFEWQHARVEVTAHRQDAPPKLTSIEYRLEIATDESDHRLELLHRNISEFGTIYNTFAAACDVHGTVQRAPATEPEREPR
jgi:uncharacterized OsmC-like protein